MTPEVELRTPLLHEKSDEQLVELTRLGNPAAFETLFRRYSPRLVRFSETMLGNGSPHAEDIVQEVMASARSAMAGEQRPAQLRPWLYQVTRNKCLNHLRDESAAKRPPVSRNGTIPDGYSYLEQIIDRGPSTVEQVESRAELRQLFDDLCELPESQRTALILRELDGLGYREMAEAMKVSVPSVKSLLVRGRLGLAEMAEGRELDCDKVRIALARTEQRLGDLRPAERAHLKGCEDCKQLRKRLRATSKSLAALSPIGLSLSMQGALASALNGSEAAIGAAGAGAAAGTGAASAGKGAVTIGAAAAGAGGAGGAAAGGLLASGGMAAKGLIATVAASLVAAGGVYLPKTGNGGTKDAAEAPVASASATAAAPGSSSDDGSAAEIKPSKLTAGDRGKARILTPASASAGAAASATATQVKDGASRVEAADGDRGRSVPPSLNDSRGRQVPDSAVVVLTPPPVTDPPATEPPPPSATDQPDESPPPADPPSEEPVSGEPASGEEPVASEPADESPSAEEETAGDEPATDDDRSRG